LTNSKSRVGELSPALSPFRVVVGFILAALLWKGYAYPTIFAAYRNCELTDPFFPTLLRNTYVLLGLMLVAVWATLAIQFTQNRILLRIQTSVLTLCMIGLCIHQGSYNDATFVTCFWVSLWCVWYTFRIDDPVDQLFASAKTFAILIISMIFLGGAVGKLTPEYWSGEVFYQIYFVDRDFWVFNLLRARFDLETLREISTYYSRMVIVTELAVAGFWLLPRKIAAILTLAVLLGLTLFSNTALFSVTFCLIGLCLFMLHESKDP
jgi:hypothetical protein